MEKLHKQVWNKPSGVGKQNKPGQRKQKEAGLTDRSLVTTSILHPMSIICYVLQCTWRASVNPLALLGKDLLKRASAVNSEMIADTSYCIGYFQENVDSTKQNVSVDIFEEEQSKKKNCFIILYYGSTKMTAYSQVYQ